MSDRPSQPAKNGTSRRPDGLVKISELARMSGVPAATIKHYLREGLLPPAPKKTGRNMSWYDPAIVERIQTIKTLQRERFLPLKVIRDLLDNTEVRRGDQITAMAIQRMLDARGQAESVEAQTLLDEGLLADDLQWLKDNGLIELIDGSLSGDDLGLARLVAKARRSGMNSQAMPVTFLRHYELAVQELVRKEIELFRSHIDAALIEANPAVAEVALEVSEQFVVYFRRRALLPIFEQLLAESGEEIG